jgi:hypothetical protein
MCGETDDCPIPAVTALADGPEVYDPATAAATALNVYEVTATEDTKPYSPWNSEPSGTEPPPCVWLATADNCSPDGAGSTPNPVIIAW